MGLLLARHVPHPGYCVPLLLVRCASKVGLAVILGMDVSRSKGSFLGRSCAARPFLILGGACLFRILRTGRLAVLLEEIAYKPFVVRHFGVSWRASLCLEHFYYERT